MSHILVSGAGCLETGTSRFKREGQSVITFLDSTNTLSEQIKNKLISNQLIA